MLALLDALQSLSQRLVIGYACWVGPCISGHYTVLYCGVSGGRQLQGGGGTVLGCDVGGGSKGGG